MSDRDAREVESLRAYWRGFDDGHEHGRRWAFAFARLVGGSATLVLVCAIWVVAI